MFLPLTATYLHLVFFIITSIIFFEVFNLLHYFPENFGAVLRWIAVLNQTNFDVKLQLVADNLIVKPVGKRGFCIDNFLDLLRQRLINLLYSTPSFSYFFTWKRSVFVFHA